MAKKNLTNVQFVKDIMENSKFGAMSQLFVIDAIGKLADAVTKAGVEEVRRQFGPNSFISPEAWFEVAKEIKSKLDNR